MTDVETSPDLRHARVYVSVMGDDAEADATVKALQEAKAFLRHELAGRITMRRVPDLDFMRDTTLDRAMRIEALLREAKGREQE